MRLGDLKIVRVYARKHGSAEGQFFYGEDVTQFRNIDARLEGDRWFASSEEWATVLAKPAESIPEVPSAPLPVHHETTQRSAYARVRSRFEVKHRLSDINAIGGAEAIEDQRWEDFQSILAERHGIAIPNDEAEMTRWEGSLEALTDDQVEAAIASVFELAEA